MEYEADYHITYDYYKKSNLFYPEMHGSQPICEHFEKIITYKTFQSLVEEINYLMEEFKKLEKNKEKVLLKKTRKSLILFNLHLLDSELKLTRTLFELK